MLFVLLLLTAGGFLSASRLAKQRGHLYTDSRKYDEYESDDEDWYTKFLEAADYLVSPDYSELDTLTILDDSPDFDAYIEYMSTALISPPSIKVGQSRLSRMITPSLNPPTGVAVR